jgi:hypothetical protein
LQVQVMHENGIRYVIIGAADTVHPPFRIENRSFTERVRIAQVCFDLCISLLIISVLIPPYFLLHRLLSELRDGCLLNLTLAFRLPLTSLMCV